MGEQTELESVDKRNLACLQLAQVSQNLSVACGLANLCVCSATQSACVGIGNIFLGQLGNRVTDSLIFLTSVKCLKSGEHKFQNLQQTSVNHSQDC